MKKTIIIILSVLALIIASLFAIPLFFKSDILSLIERQSSKYLKSDLAIKDISLSMFKNFPNLNITLSDLMLSQENDTLLLAPKFEASVNLKSLISGDEIIINNISLKDCYLAPKVDENGAVNWDIIRTDDESEIESSEKESSEEESIAIRFNNIEVKNMSLSYKDIPMNLLFYVPQLNMNLKGNFSEANTLLTLLLDLKNINLNYDNTSWLSNTNLIWDAEIGANLKDYIFRLDNSKIALNDLQLDLEGSVAFIDDKIDLDLTLNAPDTRFESVLAMIPQEYQKSLEGVKTTGEFKLNMNAKGEYYDEHLPAFNVDFAINDAGLKYPELPESIDNINLQLQVNNPGGPLSGTVVDMSKLSFTLANNPFTMNLHLSNPEDPVFKGGMNGTINFKTLKKALPLENITLDGILTANLNLDGRYEYIEKEQYEKFAANGKLTLKDILFKNESFPEGVSIPTGDMTVTPAKLNLNNLALKINSSDMLLEGYISNYLPYLFKNQTLSGDFTLSSNMLNLNEFMTLSDTTVVDTTETSIEVIQIPKNLNLTLNSNINTILFDQLTIKNTKGNIQLKNGIANLKNLGMDLLNGRITFNGSYSSIDLQKPTVNMNLQADSIDIEETLKSFSFIAESLPIAMDCRGTISAAFKFASLLDQEMAPIMKTANGSGNLSASNFLINNNPTLNKLSTVLKNEELNRVSISDMKIDFKIDNGDITVEPFKVNLAGQPTTIYGTQTVTGDMNYIISMNIDRKYFGSDIDKVISAIPGSANIKNLDVDVKIGGTLDKPTVSPDLTKALKSIEKAAAGEVKDNLIKGLENLFKKK